jgi:phosphatidylglycerophosphatase A
MMSRFHVRSLLRDPLCWIACGLGSGLSPYMPGTVGTAFAWFLYPMLLELSGAYMLAFLGAGFLLGIVCCQRAGHVLQCPDHAAIVWDEMLAFWLVLFFSPVGFLWQCIAFLCFRFYDIVKIFPANWIDKRVKNGLGVMLDDGVAAIYALVSVWSLQAIGWRWL